MYELLDTIVAISSPISEKRVIVRLSGGGVIDALKQVFRPEISGDKAGIFKGEIAVDDGFEIEAVLYLFLGPGSYTGETVAEIHTYSNRSVTEAMMGKFLGIGVRLARAGEFTARAYLNGKIDLSQAEAVNEIIASSNRYQLLAAEKLLSGKLAQATERVGGELMDILSLIEAGMDFSGEDIEFISAGDAVARLGGIKVQLEELLAGSISYESVIDLPCVGIAGATNAGKSSLLNELLGKQRSIVSDEHKTTRDILTGTIDLPSGKAVLFDCAGLIEESRGILDELSQRRAIESLNRADVVVFCVDVSKASWAEDLAIRKLIKPEVFILIATKADCVTKEKLAEKISSLNKLFGADFLAISVKENFGTEKLRDSIDEKILEHDRVEGGNFSESLGVSGPGLTVRHRQAVSDAIENISESIVEIESGNDEVAAMMLRNGYQSISNISQENIDEQILENIFGRFCVGK
ncbi:MAG: GTP-binding protein [Planctomycetes bacterium]|nr:GTP-binding protein [Planctomycetota bacterium]